jgi:hypothetical protein
LGLKTYETTSRGAEVISHALTEVKSKEGRLLVVDDNTVFEGIMCKMIIFERN